MMAELAADEAGTAAAAKGILGWHAAHRFCANCGASSAVADAGWRRSCPACGAQHFPRTDPVVIMLILHGNAAAARPARRPGRRGCTRCSPASWSPANRSRPRSGARSSRRPACRSAAVDYLSSQPWPFPSSLMIGCRGEALAREIALRPGRARGRALGQPRGGDGGARRPATPTSAPPAAARSPAS